MKIERIPEGLIFNRLWLKKQGISSSLVDYYLRKGYFEALSYGVYRRPGPPLKWQHLVYSLQVLGYKVYVGGRTALELQGLAHYLPLGEKQTIHLFSNKKLPKWINKINIPVKFIKHSLILFNKKTLKKGLTTSPFGSWDWPINLALPERSILEMLAGIPHKESFHMGDVFMESAVNLRPRLLMNLLEGCKSIKVKRLFLWFAEKHKHQWLTRLNLGRINLGTGKRVIQKDGKLDCQYLITVPKEKNNG